MAHSRLAYKAPTTSFRPINKSEMVVVGEVNDRTVTKFENKSATVAKWLAGTQFEEKENSVGVQTL
jgi:hypothetical protein